MTVRVLAVIAAILLVVAFALASLLPPMLPLAQAISIANHGWLVSLQNAVRDGVSEWVWLHLFMPLLLRPAWLTPAALGMLAGGAALTLQSHRDAPRSHRHRG
ncbi:conserved protein of unknown function [Rhodovastum atsumiense]|uniref:Uncharacterized protein n=1 Tax=Rhodovastum atsumiense TaxID=504468 RepID=A0A5M6INV0_9PROT|nr:hypothetical protein [Rhodovastum atsumiense]KAA5609932.1 hypothetical protein F1189_21815 [Rhodovastum atsumiense]CAH2604551.1 conserved protein of unknown function [Rhodovastum atsumiense]